MEMARRHPQRVSRLALVATALAIPVNPALLEMARTREAQAINAMISWGHDQLGHVHEHTMPGQSHLNYGIQQMASNPPGSLYADLKACAEYADGVSAAQAVECPVLCILAGRDRMTPLKFGRQMAAALNGARIEEISRGGHMLPAEFPLETNRALRVFLAG